MTSVPVNKMLLFLLVFISLFYGLNAPLFDEDEGFYAEGSREMLANNEFVTITANGQQRYDKPPLVFWMVVGSQWLFGAREWAVRLPSVIMSLALILLMYRFSKQYSAEDSSDKLVVFFAGSVQLSMISKAAIADATLQFLLVTLMLNLWKFIHHEKKKYLVLAYAAAGFAFLAKGPVAVIIPAGVVLIYVVRFKEWKQVLRLFHLPSLLLFLLIVIPWFYLCYQKVGFFVIEDFFLKHNVGRFTNAMESHGGSWFYYIPVFFLGLIPFAFVHFKTLLQWKAWRSDRRNFFLAVWFILVFVLFSASGTKLPHYILLGYVPLLMMSAGRNTETGWKGVVLSGIFLVAVFLTVPLVAPRFSGIINDDYVRAVIKGSVEVFDMKYYFVMTFFVVFLVMLLLYKSPKNKMMISSFLVILAFNTFFIYYGKIQQQPVKEMALFTREIKEEIVMPNHYLPSFSFYAQRVCEIREPLAGELAFGKITDFKNHKIRIIREKYGVGLVRIQKPG
jgi:4-amino-4-deoxy-L-arabinose transferase-like glycosyltransferase